MTRKFFFTICFLCGCLSATYAQQALRDSLAKASEALEWRPDSVHLRLKKAAWNVELQQWDYAKDEYDKVLTLDPDNPAALYYRAYVNQQMGRYKFSRADYEHLLRIVPGNFNGLLGLALLNDKDHKKTEALDQMNRLVEQFPDSAVAYAARAGMERDRGLLELAEYDFTEALHRDAGNTDYLLARADLRLLMNRKREAREDLDRLVTLGISRVALADFYVRLKNK